MLRVHLTIGLSGILLPLLLTAQDIDFVPRNDLLNPVTGFVGYSDCIVDMDGDGRDDVVRVGSKGIYIDFLQADGMFVQSFIPLAVRPPDWSMCAGDLDNNGFTDLLLADGYGVSFVRAAPDTSVYGVQIMTDTLFCQRSTLADINRDGLLDAFVCNDTGRSATYLNLGNGVMSYDRDLFPTSPLAGNYSAIWTDFNNDGLSDLHISKCFGGAGPGDPRRTNLLYRQNADGSFSEVGSEAGVNDNAQSWTTVAEDFDNDGDFDLFVINHEAENRLYRNNGDGTFTDVISQSGLAGAGQFSFEGTGADFNNDGNVDLFCQFTIPLYLGNGDLTFTPNPGFFSAPGAIGDLNGDGFPDVLTSGIPYLNSGNWNHWIKVILKGIASNANGIGARIEMHGPWGVQVREVRSGQSYRPMSSLTTSFGLGLAEYADSIVVRWPSGEKSSRPFSIADTTYVLVEPGCTLPEAMLSFATDTLICPGDTISISAPPGFVQYSWSTRDTTSVISVASEGFFYAEFTDTAGCTGRTNVVRVAFAQTGKPLIHADNSLTRCAGEQVSFSTDAGSDFIWFNGAVTRDVSLETPGEVFLLRKDGCTGDTISSDTFSLTILSPQEPEVVEVQVSGDSTAILIAEGEACRWYDAPAGGILLSDTCVLVSEQLSGDTVFYLASASVFPEQNFTGGKMTDAGPGGIGSQAGYLLAEAWEPFELISVEVYVPEGAPEGVRFIQLFHSDTLLDFVQTEVHRGMNVIKLNFDIPRGRFSLRCPQGNLFRNTGPLDYPYRLGNAGQVTGTSFGEAYYYYFYNWKMRTPATECLSARIPVFVQLTSLPSGPAGHEVSVYPNPASTEMHVRSEESLGVITLLDVFGKPCMTADGAGRNEISLDLHNVPAGTWLLRIQDATQATVRKVFVIR